MKTKTAPRLSKILLVILLLGFLSAGLINNKVARNKKNVTANLNQSSENMEEKIPWKANAKNKVKLQWYVNFSWFGTKWGEDIVSKKITELTGVDVEYIMPFGDEAERLNSFIASDNLPDILTLGWWDSSINEMIAQGMVAPLNELAKEYDMYFFEVAVPERLKWYTKDDGNVYGYPNASYAPSDYSDLTTSNQSFLVRKDIYEAIGSPDMSTPEGFLKALSDAKEMFPTVGGEDLIPLGLQEFTEDGNDSIEEYLQNFLAIPHEVDGKVYDRFSDEEYVRWLKVLREANEMGLINREVFVDKRSQMEEKIAKKLYFAMLYQWSDCQTQLKSIYAETPEQVYVAIDGPKNSKGSNHMLSGPSIQGWTVTMISQKSPYKDRAIHLMSMLMSDEGQKLIWAGVEGQTYDVIEGKVVYKPEVLQLLRNDRAKFDKVYGAMTTHWGLMDNPLAERMGVVAADDEPIKSIKEWTTKYVVNNSVYSYDGIKPNSKEAEAKARIDAEKGRILPKLILANSDEEFDQLLNGFLEFREKNGFHLIMEEYQRELNLNKSRLGLLKGRN